MEPLTTAVIAIGSIVATKALEKTGEKVGETLYEKTNQFLSSLNKQSPDTVTAIQKADEQPLDYGQAIIEVEKLVKTNPEISQTAQDLEKAAQAEPNLNLSQSIGQIINESKQPTIINNSKLADSMKNVFQGNTIIGGTF